MTINKGRWVGIVAVLMVSGMLLGWDYFAKHSGSPRLVKLVTAPLGDLARGDRDRTRPPPSVVNVAPPPLTGGARMVENASAKNPAEETRAEQQIPNGKGSVPSRKPGEAAVALAATAPDNKIPDTSVRTETEPSSVVAPTGIGMQVGAIVAHGRQAPDLRLSLNSAAIEELVASKRAVVEVENGDNRALYFLDRPDGSFHPISEISVATMSNRYIAVTDAGLVSSWLVRLGQLPSNSYRFGLRFSKSFDETIVEQQFASLIKHGIDFDQALARGTKVTTHGSVADGLGIVINTVSVEQPSRVSAE
jgi:hypothetical protein